MSLLKTTRTKIMKKLQLLALLLLLPGCTTVVHNAGKSQVSEGTSRMVMPPFLNATENEHAGQALTQLTGSTLLEYGMPLYQTEDILSKTADETAPKQEARYLQIAQENKATYLLLGTVHEYRYKSDLSANPAVGITLRLVNVADGVTLWQGSSSKVGLAYSSLTSTAQKAVRDLVSKLPLNASPAPRSL
jgi:polysaccharide biosynthesis protein PelC